MKIIHPHTASGHEGNRKKVCAPCGRKIPETCPRKLNINQIRVIKDYMETDFDLANPVFPVGICGNCRKILSCVYKDSTKKTLLPDMKNYKDIVLPKCTRQRGYVSNCSCLICLIGSDKTRKPAYQKRIIKGNIEKIHELPGLSKDKHPKIKHIGKQRRTFIKICAICKQEVSGGKRHKCVISSASKNVAQHASDLPEKQRDQIVSKLLFQKVGDQTHNDLSLNLHTKGSKLRVKMNPNKGKDNAQLTHASIDTLQLNLGLSNSKTRLVNHWLRAHMGRKSCSTPIL